MEALRAEFGRLAPGRPPPRRHDAEYSAFDAVAEVSDALADRSAAMLDRILASYEMSLPAPAPETATGPLPRLDQQLGPAALEAQQGAQIKWVVDELVRRLRPLTRTVADVQKRSRDWSTPAARQLNLDVSRFRSRLVNTMRLEDPAPREK